MALYPGRRSFGGYNTFIEVSHNQFRDRRLLSLCSDLIASVAANVQANAEPEQTAAVDADRGEDHRFG